MDRPDLGEKQPIKQTPVLNTVFTGQPQTIQDTRGMWTSSIYRQRVEGPVRLYMEGLEGDKVTQPYHGGLGAAVCVHLMDHYRFWNRVYDMELQPGYVGENFTLDGLTEAEVCAGDIVQVGTGIVQVSGPRIPCANLARRIGRPDWVRLTLRENRTGFYLRVLEAGEVQAGDSWKLMQRLNPEGSNPEINRAMFLEYDTEFLLKMQQMEGLEDWWKEQALERLAQRQEHWTAELKEKLV